MKGTQYGSPFGLYLHCLYQQCKECLECFPVWPSHSGSVVMFP